MTNMKFVIWTVLSETYPAGGIELYVVVVVNFISDRQYKKR